MYIKKIISGGQTGVDCAALDIAIKLNISHGGWCPRNRHAEDGKIADIYKMRETQSTQPEVRTKLNVSDSDGTLVFVPVMPITVNDGTNLTIESAKHQRKPYYICDLSVTIDLDQISQWILDNNIKVINVAGPRESQAPGIYGKCFNALKCYFDLFMLNYVRPEI